FGRGSGARKRGRFTDTLAGRSMPIKKWDIAGVSRSLGALETLIYRFTIDVPATPNIKA
ncbi:hypothetical protein E4U14_004731, partial [Claviceps sp. LM454 group G7]